MRLIKDASLQELNTFGVDVNCSELYVLETVNNIAELSNLTNPLFLGGGSNILFTKNYEGSVIHNRLKGVSLVSEDERYYYVKVYGGENWHNFVTYTLGNRWYGLEALSLIPGTVGAAPVQNIGAYGAEISQFIDTIKAYDLNEHTMVDFSNEGCNFSYRSSFFKKNLNRYLITSVLFKLNKIPTSDVTYQALQEWFLEHKEIEVSPESIAQAVIEIRRNKLPDPGEIGNVGSFFENPIVPKNVYEELLVKYPDLVAYPIGERSVKLSAGQLIEIAGFKGKYENNVGMYEKQALVLVNLGGATGEALYLYAMKVKDRVKGLFEIDLIPEPVIL